MHSKQWFTALKGKNNNNDYRFVYELAVKSALIRSVIYLFIIAERPNSTCRVHIDVIWKKQKKMKKMEKVNKRH